MAFVTFLGHVLLEMRYLRGASLVRVHNFSISLDEFGTGEGQSADAHFGHAGDRLHEWMFATGWWKPGGSSGVDDAFIRRHDPGSAPRSWAPGNSVIPDGMTIRSGRVPGAQPAVPYACVRPHSSHAPVDRDGGRHDLPLHRCLAGRGARQRRVRLRPARTCASAEAPP